MSDSNSKYAVTQEMIENTHNKIKLKEFVNKLFGYPKNSATMAEDIVKIINEMIPGD